MNFIKKTILFILILFMVIPFLGLAGQVIDRSSGTATFQAKWNQTLAFGKKQQKEFWLAYSIQKEMPENSYYISTTRIVGHIHTDSFSSIQSKLDGISLGTQIYGKSYKPEKPQSKSDRQQIKEAAQQAIDNIKSKHKKHVYKKVKKEVVVLVGFDTSKGESLQSIRLSNLIFPFNSKGKPIYWIGKSDESRSLELLKGLFQRAKDDTAKKRLVSIISSHSLTKDVIPFLVNVVNSDEADKVRAKAASELGDVESPEVVKILLGIAKNDHSLEVRKKAVGGLEDVDTPAAVDALIHIANKANNTYIRKKAINSLEDVGTQKAADALKYIAFNDKDVDVQRKAVNALEDLPHNLGVSYLIEIARTHPSPYIRKKALNNLGDIKDPRAFEAIKAIAEGK